MLDANAAVPLYAQLEQKIESQIANRALHPGDRLPTEAQLARENGISVITVRKAIDGLVRKGLLECKQGKGTFVSHHKLQRNMKKLQSFSDMCRQMGMKPGARMVENHLVPASAPIARRLGVDAGSSVIYISRLRLADGVFPVLASLLSLSGATASAAMVISLESVRIIRRSTTCSTYFLESVIYSRQLKYAFQLLTITHRLMVARMGALSGSITRTSTCQLLAPSMVAASRTSSEMF